MKITQEMATPKSVSVKGKLLKLDIQHFGNKGLMDLKADMSTVGEKLKQIKQEIQNKAVDPGTKTEEIQALKASEADYQMRFELIKANHDEVEAEQRKRFNDPANLASIEDPKDKTVKAKADLIKATMKGAQPSKEVYAALGDDDTTKGGKFLPKTVSSEIISEPFVRNQLRGLSEFTQITNLEIPKLNFTLDDDDFILDKETAKELEATGDVVEFERHKFKVFAGLSETVLNGTHTNLVSQVDRALGSGVAAKEKKVALTKTPKVGEEHMSFYDTSANGPSIVRITGVNKYEAILNSIADLHEDYRDNAQVLMSFKDWTAIIKDLSNGNTTFYNAQPEQILGKPVVFSDSAVDPIVGDFQYSHFNYDLNMLFDRDKDVKTGIDLFVITAWMDHQIKLSSAFRIAEVETEPIA